MELPDRYDFEADFAARIAKLSARQRRELEDYVWMTYPPDILNVPESAWQKWEQEANDDLLLLLLLIASSSAEYHGSRPGDDQVALAITGWASERAAAVSRSYIQTTQRGLFELFEDIGNRRAAVPFGPAGRTDETGRIQPAEPETELTPEKIDTEITDKLDDLFGPSRVEGIAITETTAAQNSGGEIAVEATVGTSPDDVWITVNDGKVCPTCTPLHRTTRDFWGRFFPDGPPQPHPRCVLPGSVIHAPGRVLAASKAFYDGTCVEATFADGRRISITENHPILTDYGWVAAKCLTKGANVFSSTNCERAISLINPHNDNRPSRIEDIFASLHMASGMSAARVPASAKHFHGDGKSIHSQIEIVRAKGDLRGRVDAMIQKHLSQFALLDAHADLFRGTAFSIPASFSERNTPATRRFMRCQNCGRSLGGRHSSPPVDHGPGLVASIDPRFSEIPSKDAAADAQRLRNGLLTFSRDVSRNRRVTLRQINTLRARDRRSSFVSADPHQFVKVDELNSHLARQFVGVLAGHKTLSEVVNVRHFRYAGHVYDLQVEGWELYFCNGAIVHNCRCWVEYANVAKETVTP